VISNRKDGDGHEHDSHADEDERVVCRCAEEQWLHELTE
jgi:hypothetical protein